MVTSVYFAGSNFLDAYDTRLSMLRIPEVVHRLRVAQQILENHLLLNIDLISCLSSDDSGYLHNNNLKSLLVSLVQLGLYDRFLKNSLFPHFLVGNGKGPSTLKVIVGEMSFEELVVTSPAVQVAPVISITNPDGLPVLLGTALAELVVFRTQMLASGEVRFEKEPMASLHLRDITQCLLKDHGVERWVNIGPTPVQFSRDWKVWNTIRPELSCLSSFDVDPMLGWFAEPFDKAASH